MECEFALPLSLRGLSKSVRSGSTQLDLPCLMRNNFFNATEFIYLRANLKLKQPRGQKNCGDI